MKKRNDIKKEVKKIKKTEDSIANKRRNKIEPDHVRKLLGILSDLPIYQLVESIINCDFSKGIHILHDIKEQGTDLHYFRRELLEYLRTLLMINAKAHKILDLSTEELEQRKTLAVQINMTEIANAINLFGKLEIRYDKHSYLPIETTLLELCLERHASYAKPLDTPSHTVATIPLNDNESQPIKNNQISKSIKISIPYIPTDCNMLHLSANKNHFTFKRNEKNMTSKITPMI